MTITKHIGGLLLIAASLSSLPISPARAQSPEMTERSEDELVLVDIILARTILAEAMPGYANKSGLMLPLGELSKALQLNITTRPKEGIAEGFIINENNSFTLDAGRKEVVIAGTRKNVAPTQIELHEDDIYIDTALLKDWLQVDFDFSFATQTVQIKPREGVKLPIQIRTEREEARQMIGRSDIRGAEGPFPRKEIPYQLATIPFTDVTYTGGYDKRAYAGQHNAASVLADGDLLYMQSRVYGAVADSSDVTDFRMTLSRRDPEGKILQSDDKLKYTKLGEAMDQYEIREVSFGDISTEQLPLTAFNQQARGVLISNIPYDRATQFDRTTIQGDLQTGWEVELYRNDELLSFQRASANGRYEFVDVPLLNGVNIIRLVFYGPFGQTREEVQRFLVSDQLTQQGKSYFRTSVSQQNTNSFDVLNQNQVVSLSGATPEQLEAIKGKPRAMFEYEYGLLDNMSLFTSSSHLTTPDNVEHTYITAGAGATIAGAYGRADIARDVQNGGNAFKVQAQDNFDNVSVSAEHQQYFDFVSEFTELVNDPVTRRSSARADAPLTLPYLPRLNNGISFTQTLYDSERKVDEYAYRVSTAVNRLSLSHNLIYRTDTSPAPVNLIGIGGVPITFTTFDKQTTGEFLLSMPLRNILFRGGALYGITPERELQTLLAAAEYSLSRDTNLIAQVDKQYISERLTNVTIGASHNFEQFRLGSNIGHASDGETTLGVTLSLSFGEDPRSGKFRFYPDYSAANGIISARAYHDINGDNIFNEGDRPVENAKFFVNRGTTQQSTDPTGAIMIRNLTPDTRTSLTLDSKSIDNPYLMSKDVGVDVVTRPGVAAVVDFPITGSGDVEGTVHIMGIEAETKEAANVAIQLFDVNGKLVRETQTSFDGYYLINGVPAGRYRLRVSLDQAGRLGFITPADREIVISNEETDSHIIDLTIIREPEETWSMVTLD